MADCNLRSWLLLAPTPRLQKGINAQDTHGLLEQKI